jgi:hypothetical protein
MTASRAFGTGGGFLLRPNAKKVPKMDLGSRENQPPRFSASRNESFKKQKRTGPRSLRNMEPRLSGHAYCETWTSRRCCPSIVVNMDTRPRLI